MSERPSEMAERMLDILSTLVHKHPEEILGKAPDSGETQKLKLALTMLRVAWQEFESGNLPRQYGQTA